MNFLEACVWDPRWDEPRWIEGEVLISRSPTVHPGDAQIAEAIGKPPAGSPFELDNLPNTLVFSCKGQCL
jgi:RNA-dependent RNA polymerase